MTRESTLAPTTTLKDEPSSSKLENIRTKLSPLLLYVVSTAQFLDIGTFYTKKIYALQTYLLACASSNHVLTRSTSFPSPT